MSLGTPGWTNLGEGRPTIIRTGLGRRGETFPDREMVTVITEGLARPPSVHWRVDKRKGDFVGEASGTVTYPYLGKPRRSPGPWGPRRVSRPRPTLEQRAPGPRLHQPQEGAVALGELLESSGHGLPHLARVAEDGGAGPMREAAWAAARPPVALELAARPVSPPRCLRSCAPPPNS